MAKSCKSDFPKVDGIHILSLIGKGSFSHVYKGVLLKERENVAIKVIDKKDLTPGKVDIITSEIGIMKSLNHPHIVRLKDFKWDPKSVYIILEYCEGGNLYEYIKLKNRLKERVCKRALQQLASGLAYLRSKNICHMDLKPQNILIKFNPFTIKIADFGLAQHVPEEKYLDSLRGSPLYMAPEILAGAKYSSKVDLWSVGVILYECLYGRAPLAHKNWQELVEALTNRVPIKYSSAVPISSECKDLLEKLLVYDPDERISYDDFFNHPFLDLAHAPSEENKRLAFRIIAEAVRYDEKKDYARAFNSYCRALRYLVPLLDSLTASEERAYLQVKVTEYLTRAEELKTFLFKNTKKRKKENVQKLSKSDEHTAREVAKLVSRGSSNISSLISSDPVSYETTDSRECSNGKENGSSGEALYEKFKNCSVETQEGEDEGASNSATKEENTSFFESDRTFPDDLFSSQSIKDMFANSPKIHSALDIGFTGQMYMMQGDYDIAFSKYETALSVLIAEIKDYPQGSKRDFLLLQIRKWLAEAEGAKTLASAKSLKLCGNLKSGVEVMDSNCSIQ